MINPQWVLILQAAAAGAQPFWVSVQPSQDSRLIQEVQDTFPMQFSTDHLTSALYPLKLINLLTPDC